MIVALNPAIRTAAIHPRATNAVFNVGEETTPSMGERLAKLPSKGCKPEEPPSFDFRQPLVLDTSKITRELGYTDIVDERSGMADVLRETASWPESGGGKSNASSSSGSRPVAR